MTENLQKITITIKFLSMLRKFAGTNEIKVALQFNQTLKDLLHHLQDNLFNERKIQLITDIGTSNEKIADEILVLINDMDSKVFDGLDTILENNDVISLISSIHGG